MEIKHGSSPPSSGRRMREDDAPALLQPRQRTLRRRAHDRRGPDPREDIYGPEVSLVELRKAVGMFFTPQPAAHLLYENVVFGFASTPPRSELGKAVSTRRWRSAHRGRPVKDLKDRLDAKRRRSSSSSSRSSARPPPALKLGGHPHGRAGLRPRRRGHAAIEALMFALACRYTIVIVTHNMAQASGRATSACSCCSGARRARAHGGPLPSTRGDPRTAKSTSKGGTPSR